MRTKTVEEVRAEARRKGLTFADLARQHGLRYQDVVAVLNHKAKGRNGRAHQVAVALGLKEGEPA